MTQEKCQSNLDLKIIFDWLTKKGIKAEFININKAENAAQIKIQGFSLDSREIAQNDLFIAINGANFNAADFLKEVAEKGASAAICANSAREKLEKSGIAGILISDENVITALGAISAGYREQFNLPLIAITGSNGKTTVTQMIARILDSWLADKALATKGNFNNEIGVPITLFRLNSQHKVAAVEMGMNHAGEIEKLAKIASPTIALVNNAQREHQEFMHTVKAVAIENANSIKALPADGIAIFPSEDEYTPLWQNIAGDRKTITFTANLDSKSKADIYLKSAVYKNSAWKALAHTPQGDLTFELNMAGAHNLHNALAAAAACMAAGTPLEKISAGLKVFTPASGRSSMILLKHRGKSINLIDDTYNANPDSMRALIDTLAQMPQEQLLVIGDMAEVGERGQEFHAEIGAYARQKGISRLLAHGELAIHAAMAFGQGRHFEKMQDLIEAVKTHIASSLSGNALQSIGVKGSRAMKMEQLVAALIQAQADKVEKNQKSK